MFNNKYKKICFSGPSLSKAQFPAPAVAKPALGGPIVVYHPVPLPINEMKAKSKCNKTNSNPTHST